MDTKTGKKYSARWSGLVWAVTGFIFAMFVVLLILAIALAHWVPLIFVVLLGVFIVAAFLFAPQSYTLTESAVIINRPGFSLKIPFESITQMRRLDKGDLGSVMRVAGMGGLFGFWGRFQSSTIGPFKCYMTRNDNMVLLQDRAGEKIILSPSNLNDFVETIMHSKNYTGDKQ
ncbi:MAG: hypothetical protein FJ263_00220 [Planctomycetes bacterium]|nr:hypothetical protein [Planctomycetota bacterium]